MTFPQNPYGPQQPPQPPVNVTHVYSQGAGPQLPTSGMATASLVLGLVGLIFGWCLLGIPSVVAIILGHVGISQTKNNKMSGRGSAVAGLVLGYISLVGNLIFTVIFFISVIASTPTTEY